MDNITDEEMEFSAFSLNDADTPDGELAFSTFALNDGGIPDGDYYIFSVNNTGLAIDVSASSFKNGANIQLWDKLQNDAQTWRVSTREDGTLQIASRLCGKCLDIDSGMLVGGTNVQLWDDNDSAAQCFIAEKAGETTIDGETYDNYYIKVNSNPSLRLIASGSRAGANVKLAGGVTTNYAKWVFFPVPTILTSGGVYEIRSMLDPMMGLDVLNGSTANGTNVQIFPANGANAQKFVLKNEGDGWSIRNIASSKYLDVKSGAAVNGQNVQTWEDNDGRAQRWTITSYGTTEITGREFIVVKFGSLVDGVGDHFFLDVQGSDKHAFTNVQIYEDTYAPAQRWALVPSYTTDPSMPAPYSLGLCSGEMTGDGEDYGYEDEAAYATWKCAPAWCADGGNHYEMRTRRRFMSPTMSTWGEWGDWDGWNVVVAKNDGQQSWSSYEVQEPYTWATAKNEQVEVQVRSAGASGLELLHGNYTSDIFNIYKKPAVNITSAVWSPSGLKMAFDSDYEHGMTYLTFTDIDGKLEHPATIGDNGKHNVVVSRDSLNKWYRQGDSVDFKYKVGYDQRQVLPGTDARKTLTVSTAGGSIDLAPVFVEDGARLLVVFTNAGTSRAWTKFDNEFLELAVADDYEAPAGKVAYEVIYPTNGKEFSVFAETSNAAETQWGSAEATYKMSRICHAWTLNGRSFYVRTFLDAMPTYTYSHSAAYEADVLDGRKREAVSFSGTVKGSLTAEGVLLHGEETTARDIENLVGKHCVFRDINGGVRRVAVVDATITRHETFDEVSVAMIEETV